MTDPGFEAAIGPLLNHEGGYVNDAQDPGGETKYGISKRQYPDLDIADLTVDQARAIYHRDYWLALKADRMPLRVGVKLFDLAVNVGVGTAGKLLQRALRACGDPALVVEEDGAIGVATLNAVQQAPQNVLLAALRSEAAGHYRVLVAEKPMQLGKFLRGWTSRAYA
jgi:lysozyme family protein